MLYIFFGQDKVASGHSMIPGLLYFIGLFLGQEEPLNTPYKGRFFREGGRFVCVGNPNPHGTVVSEFDLSAAFRIYFKKDDVPMISGLTLGIDTFRSGDGEKQQPIFTVLNSWNERSEATKYEAVPSGLTAPGGSIRSTR
jgi:hypothetical protein